jgi:hypothetical protein
LTGQRMEGMGDRGPSQRWVRGECS